MKAEFKRMLKENENIIMMLVPSASSDNKELEFDWQISKLETTGIELNLSFERPELVSTYEARDIMKIKFLETHTFMQDINGLALNILPSGYEILTELPMLVEVIDDTILKITDKENVQASSQTFLTAVPIICFFFNLSMQ
mmetsp:Transcript_25298/g.31670  ORF Transcript_25298/g.31670 Transcript_25298/m.31670 type:complete len:141 (+) Transcript_25298:1013-1435(+)|eukprot:CAMPEP_0170477964 /NCGR_PEP_ID=MMETSP0123-20130129/19111_1 /TAXON_ID=182087 /ORGANISM="Favella ehrenbergii, Strain Fehren 1" /LENGTH=140 /DNA_ID=CAMNT_0010749993 /DNA_START=861 /DNA_END=1283 /DNA_ORIENTATION=-